MVTCIRWEEVYSTWGGRDRPRLHLTTHCLSNDIKYLWLSICGRKCVSVWCINSGPFNPMGVVHSLSIMNVCQIVPTCLGGADKVSRADSIWAAQLSRQDSRSCASLHEWWTIPQVQDRHLVIVRARKEFVRFLFPLSTCSAIRTCLGRWLD